MEGAVISGAGHWEAILEPPERESQSGNPRKLAKRSTRSRSFMEAWWSTRSKMRHTR